MKHIILTIILLASLSGCAPQLTLEPVKTYRVTPRPVPELHPELGHVMVPRGYHQRPPEGPWRYNRDYRRWRH